MIWLINFRVNTKPFGLIQTLDGATVSPVSSGTHIKRKKIAHIECPEFIMFVLESQDFTNSAPFILGFLSRSLTSVLPTLLFIFCLPVSCHTLIMLVTSCLYLVQGITSVSCDCSLEPSLSQIRNSHQAEFIEWDKIETSCYINFSKVLSSSYFTLCWRQHKLPGLSPCPLFSSCVTLGKPLNIVLVLAFLRKTDNYISSSMRYLYNLNG